MISLRDSLITNSLPAALSEQVEVKAIAYALSIQIKKLYDCALKIKLYSDIENCPSEALDILAADMAIQQYDANYPISVKRRLVLDSFANWIFSGTRAQLENIAESIFGGSTQIIEWFDGGFAPGTFRVVTDSPDITEENVSEFQRVIEISKRLSAKLDGIEISLSVPKFKEVFAFMYSENDKIILNMEGI